VSTIDGNIHAFKVTDSPGNEVNKLWNFNTGTMISSSINKLEVAHIWQNFMEFILNKLHFQAAQRRTDNDKDNSVP
jgi:hypothetical protein